jgi:hypothetical protein
LSFGVIFQLLAQGVADTLCCTAQDLALSYHESSTMTYFLPVSGQSPGLPAPAPGGPHGRAPAEAGQRTGWTPAPARCLRVRRALLRRHRPPRLPGQRRPGGKGCLWQRTRRGRSPAPLLGSVAKFDFWAKSKNWVSGIQRLTDSQTLEKATLRQNPVSPIIAPVSVYHRGSYAERYSRFSNQWC